MSAASPRQYSADVLQNIIFGALPRSFIRPSSEPLSPVTGSVCSVSVNGNSSGITKQMSFDGCPNRMLNSPRIPPATCGMMPSSAVRSSSSSFSPRWIICRRNRPLCEMPSA